MLIGRLGKRVRSLKDIDRGDLLMVIPAPCKQTKALLGMNDTVVR